MRSAQRSSKAALIWSNASRAAEMAGHSDANDGRNPAGAISSPMYNGHDVPRQSRQIHMPIKLTPEIISAAILGFEERKRHIDAQIAELRAMLLGGRTEPAATPEVPKSKRRKMNASARKRIGDAQRKRWAESKKESEPAPAEAPKPKRKLSAAGKAAIVAALKKRWAAKRAEAAKAQQAPAAKKTAAKKAAAKRAKKAVKKVAAKRPQKAAATPPAVPAATA
jgi:hypothetical protein